MMRRICLDDPEEGNKRRVRLEKQSDNHHVWGTAGTAEHSFWPHLESTYSYRGEKDRREVV